MQEFVLDAEVDKSEPDQRAHDPHGALAWLVLEPGHEAPGARHLGHRYVERARALQEQEDSRARDDAHIGPDLIGKEHRAECQKPEKDGSDEAGVEAEHEEHRNRQLKPLQPAPERVEIVELQVRHDEDWRRHHLGAMARVKTEGAEDQGDRQAEAKRRRRHMPVGREPSLQIRKQLPRAAPMQKNPADHEEQRQDIDRPRAGCRVCQDIGQRLCVPLRHLLSAEHPGLVGQCAAWQHRDERNQNEQPDQGPLDRRRHEQCSNNHVGVQESAVSPALCTDGKVFTATALP